MEEAIRDLLLGDSGVSTLARDRVNFGSNPQGAGYPAVVLFVISEQQRTNLDGLDGIASARIQVNCIGGTYGAAKQLSRAVRSTLSGYFGGALQGVFYASMREGREGGANEPERPFHVSLDFIVKYTTQEAQR